MAVLSPEANEYLEKAKAFVNSIPLLSPRDIEEAIREEGYIGQDRAVRAVSLMAYRHIKRLKHIYLMGVKRESIPEKTNMLFVGPTGCGKTYLVEILFKKILKLPTVIVDITGFSETGYVGQDVNSILTRLIYAANMDPIAASFGIVCIDEFDKLSSGSNNAVFAGAGTTKDVSGLGVQRELLKILESTEVPVPLEFSHSDYTPKVIISTTDIDFIACGAFSGLKGVIEYNKGEHIGFGRRPIGADVDRIAVNYSIDEVEAARNFRDYGFLPELIGRFKRIVPFHALSKGELRKILERNVLSRYREEFKLEGKRLLIGEEVIGKVVRDSIKKETGARGLEASLVGILEDAAFEVFSDPGSSYVKLVLEESSGDISYVIG